MSQEDRDRLGITTVGDPPSTKEIDARRRIREMGGAVAVLARLDALRTAAKARSLTCTGCEYEYLQTTMGADECPACALAAVTAERDEQRQRAIDAGAIVLAVRGDACDAETQRDALRAAGDAMAVKLAAHAPTCDALARWREVVG